MPSPSKASQREPAQGLSHTFARLTLPAISALLLLSLLASVIVLVHLAHSQDRQALAQTLFFADKALQARRDSLLRSLIDNAFWGDAYLHMNDGVDTGWAYESQNLGPTLFDTFGYDGILVIDPAGRTRYAVIEGQLRELDARDWLSGDLDGLIAEAHHAVAENEGVTGLMQVEGQPALVAAAEFTNDDDPRVPVRPGPASVLLFVDVLGAAKLTDLGRDYSLPNLRLADRQTEEGSPALLLGQVDGQTLHLTWDAPMPGRRLLQWVLPLIGLVGLTLAVLTGLVLRHALRAARLMDAGYARLAHSRAELAASEARFRDVAEIASDWFWETDAERRLTYLSERFEAVTGHRPEQWLGRPLDNLLEGEGQALPAWLTHCRGTLNCRYQAANGHPRICRIAARPIEHGAGLYRGSASDITEEVTAQARIQYLSQHDSLTGLPNRHRLHEFLAGKLDRAPVLEQPLVMLSIDLNRFKPVNDAFGHAAGDRVLHEVSRRLHACIREGDLVARHGGDEFIMVLNGSHSEQAIEQICMRLIESIEAPFQVNGQVVFIGASIGISSAPEDATRVEDLLRYADLALYQAKAARRSGWRFYSQDMNQLILERRQLEQDLRLALERDDQLCLHFQPRYRLDDLALVGAEALVRWQHPQRGLLGPDQFIPLAEETGLIAPLGQWVLRHACQEAMAWPAHLLVAVNLSPRQFRRSDLAAEVAAVLDATGLPAERLELEITESVMLDDALDAQTILEGLKALGLHLSMDDFGTGYSSLSYLSNYPFDALKIDRSFIADLEQSPHKQAIVQAIIGLGRALSMRVTAEGVENLAQQELLRRDGCCDAQGFHLSRPLPVSELRRLLQTGPGS
ncbi:EAL domain-containing protein [Pseudomonas sp. CAU 1711]|uniref:bifunctional diguanylate cyclase/phosphodiesterase n=1 Tax=Pseudomonas sp. CAU 1711 TaxID=3140356 RepID=UPI003261011F